MNEVFNIDDHRRQLRTEKVQRMPKMIWVKFQKEGIHKYPAALEDPALATGDEYDVSFLSLIHI